MGARSRAGHLAGAHGGRGPGVAGLRLWLTRTVALTSLATLPAALFIAYEQLGSLDPAWLALVGGGITGFSLLIPVYAWSLRDIRWLCGAYAAVALLGLATWPWVWTGPGPASAPWLWMCLSAATVCAAIATTVVGGFWYTLVAAAVYGVVRTTPSGQGLTPVQAVTDGLNVFVLPIALLILIHYFSQAVRELDASTVASQQAEADRAIDKALAQQRSVLDGLIHDRVMTTFVAAVQTDRTRRQVADLAADSLRALSEAGRGADRGQSLTARQIVRLIEGMVEEVCPQATIVCNAQDLDVAVSAAVVGTIGQAVREAALNVTRHAEADTVTIDVQADSLKGDQRIRVDISDDGKGFDPNSVDDARFGIRVSLVERMAAIGGSVTIDSEPGGGGTVVSLRWSGGGPGRHEVAAARGGSDAVRSALRVDVLLSLVWLVVGVQVMVGMVVVIAGDPIKAYLAQVLAVLATAVALRRAGERSASVWEATFVAASLVVITHLMQGGLTPGDQVRPWHVTVVMVLLIVLLVRGQRAVAWLGLAAFLTQTVWWAWQRGIGNVPLLELAFGPLLWLSLATVVLRGMRSIGAQLAQVRAATMQNSQAMADSFSQVVLREVWLAQLRQQVGPLLQQLADPAHQLTDDEREACRVLEGRLRDALRAGNLISQGVSDAIQEARRRGVDVVLVDNRGSKLPEAVRLATLRQLEGLVRASTSGRIVARTAPEGYAEAVTILSVGGERNLTTIDEAGTVTVRKK